MISLEYVVEIHRRLEELGLCMLGIRDSGLLISAINGQQWYDDYLRQYVHVAYSINAGHIFSDGNKRTSFIVIKELNKFRYYFDDNKLSDAILELACGGVSQDKFLSMVKECIIQ